MSAKKWGIIAAVLGVLAVASGSALGAPAGPFTRINGPADSEEYLVGVTLEPGQEIELIDDQHAMVHEGDQPRFSVSAEPAHDAVGSAVPTSLRLDEGEVLVLIVHHRAGNPAKGGEPFSYPVTGGVGWEGGFQTFRIEMPPPEPLPPQTAPCVVPKLKGLTLVASRTRAKSVGCRIGAVRRATGVMAKQGHVVKQMPAPGAVLAPGSSVHLRLGR